MTEYEDMLEEIVNEKDVLLDEVIFRNITIVNIKDIKMLSDKGYINIGSEKVPRYKTISGQEFYTLKICDNNPYFDKLYAGKNSIQAGNGYCHLKVTVRNGEHKNLCCYSLSDYYNVLIQINNYLEEKYGIITDFTDIKYKKMELNKTVEIEEHFDKYDRVLKIIHGICQKNSVAVFSELSGSSTYYFGNSNEKDKQNGIDLKIYDKTKQINKKFDDNDNKKKPVKKKYLRIEITINGISIEREFETARFDSIEEKDLKDVFNRQVHNRIFNKYDKWIKQRNKQIINLMKVEIEIHENQWQKNIIKKLKDEELNNCYQNTRKKYGIPLILFDIEELYDLVDKLSKQLKFNAKKKYQIKQNFKKQCMKNYNLLLQKDMDRLNELKDKILCE